MIRRPPRSTLFPTRRSSDLLDDDSGAGRDARILFLCRRTAMYHLVATTPNPNALERMGKTDRKSTRLNSSHLVISYAVFCLKKKIQAQKAVFISMAAAFKTA